MGALPTPGHVYRMTASAQKQKSPPAKSHHPLTFHKQAYYIPAVDKPAYDFLVLLNDLARVIRTEADRRARLHGMTRAQWMILARLNQSPGLSQRELAEYLEVEPITVARLVDRLEAAGQVERRPDPVDRRIWRLHLTDLGRPALDALGVQRDQLLAIVTEGVDARSLAEVSATLAQMKSNMTGCRRPEPAKKSA